MAIEDKIKVENMRNCRITLNVAPISNGKVIPIEGHGFGYVTNEELAYLMNVSKSFEKGNLRVVTPDKVDKEVDIPDAKENLMSEQEVKTLFKKSPSVILKRVDKIDNVQLLREMLEIAKADDKPMSVLDGIQKKIESLV